MPPIDSVPILRYKTSPRTANELSMAYSTRYNPRGIESEFYPPYQSALFQLTDFNFDGTLSIRTNCDLWLSSSELKLLALAAKAKDPGDGYSDVEEPDDIGQRIDDEIMSQKEDRLGTYRGTATNLERRQQPVRQELDKGKKAMSGERTRAERESHEAAVLRALEQAESRKKEAEKAAEAAAGDDSNVSARTVADGGALDTVEFDSLASLRARESELVLTKREA